MGTKFAPRDFILLNSLLQTHKRKTARTGLGFIAILDSFQRLAAKDITMTTKVKWGIMSTATIVDKILDAMQKAEGCELVAVASRSTEK